MRSHYKSAAIQDSYGHREWSVLPWCHDEPFPLLAFTNYWKFTLLSVEKCLLYQIPILIEFNSNKMTVSSAKIIYYKFSLWDLIDKQQMIFNWVFPKFKLSLQICLILLPNSLKIKNPLNVLNLKFLNFISFWNATEDILSSVWDTWCKILTF